MYKLSHEKVQERELMPKNAEKLKFFMRFVEIFNTPRFERNCRETVLEKNRFNSVFLWKKNIKNDVFLERTFFSTMWLRNNTSILENMLQKIQ